MASEHDQDINVGVKFTLKVIKELKETKKGQYFDNICDICNQKYNWSVEETSSFLEEAKSLNLINEVIFNKRKSYRICNQSSQEQNMEDSDGEDSNSNIENSETDELDFSNENLLKKDMEATENFTVLKECLESFMGLKRYIASEINKLGSGHAEVLVKHLVEENSFLRNEIRETRKMVSDILENITHDTRQNQSYVTNSCNNENGWKIPPKGNTFKSKEANSIHPNITISNRFNKLPVESLADDNNHQNDVVDVENYPFNVKINTSKNYQRPSVVINKYPERQTVRNTFESTNQRKKIKVLCDSIPKGIRIPELNHYLTHGKAQMKSFPGATIKQLHHYSLPTLQDEKPEVVIIHVGINDLLSNNVNITPEKQIADEIISIGNTCVKNGVEKVLISSLIFCQRVEWERIERINKLLKEKCEASGFINWETSL